MNPVTDVLVEDFRIIERDEWQPRYRGGWPWYGGNQPYRPLPADECYLHYPGAKAPPGEDATYEEDVAYIRYLDEIGYIRFGPLTGTGWGEDEMGVYGAGISYSLIFCKSGRIFRGHDPGRQSSHTAGHNVTGMGYCVLISNGEHANENQLNAVAWALNEQVRLGELDEAIFDGGHRDVFATLCPTDLMYDQIPEFNDRAWALHEEGETDMAKTALGWTLPSTSGTRRVGPHIASPSNPRELIIRNEATGDLLSAVWWLVHTGNGNQADKVYASQLHTARPLDADFGDALSDHKCWVALDINWSWHPWEKTVGRSAYDAHLASSTYARYHAMCRAISKRLGQGNIVRWCGEDWIGAAGTGYLRSAGNRDCMHWVIEGPYWDRINAAAASLRAWFRPPKTVEQIKEIQGIIGVTQDGQFGHGSVDAMYAYERANGLTPTGLPGTVEFWNHVNGTNAPGDNEGFSVEDIKKVQIALNALGYGPLEVDGSLGDKTKQEVKDFQSDFNLAPDGLPGPGATQPVLFRVQAANVGFTVEYVREVQVDLNTLGYYTGKITGELTTATRSAVKAFQSDHGLDPDGLPGMSETRPAIDAALAEPEPEPAPEPEPEPAPEPTPDPELPLGYAEIIRQQIRESFAALDLTSAISGMDVTVTITPKEK